MQLVKMTAEHWSLPYVLHRVCTRDPHNASRREHLQHNDVHHPTHAIPQIAIKTLVLFVAIRRIVGSRQEREGLGVVVVAVCLQGAGAIRAPFPEPSPPPPKAPVMGGACRGWGWGQGVALIFILAGGASPLDPSPPLPSRSESRNNQGSGNPFLFGPIFFLPCLWRTYSKVLWSFHSYHFFPVLQISRCSVP